MIGIEADPRDLSQSGWGVIFPADADPAVREALAPLLNLRREQAGELYWEYSGENGYRPGETRNDWLSRFGVSAGMVDPHRMPYYLLIVGSPESIPFNFQTSLSIQYAVGRIAFQEPNDYANYANSVVASTRLWMPQSVCLFSPSVPDDLPTLMFTRNFGQPLMDNLMKEGRWEGLVLSEKDASKPAFLKYLATGHPAIFLLGGHGLSYPSGHPKQLAYQGALVCTDWPGPGRWSGPIPQDFFISGEDIPSNANLTGSIVFLFCSFGAGTMAVDPLSGGNDKRQLAPRDFLAGLPQRLLSLPQGGAQAVIGIIGRSASYSSPKMLFESWPVIFKEAITRLAKGFPIGNAMDVNSSRYAELTTNLSSELEEIRFGLQADLNALASKWLMRNDAEKMIILGDPAAQLRIGSYENITSQQKAGIPTTLQAAGEGPKQKRIEAEVILHMTRVPTRLLPYLNPIYYPLVSVNVRNSDYDNLAKIDVLMDIEGFYHAQHTGIELKPMSSTMFAFYPAISADILQHIETATRAKMNVTVMDANHSMTEPFFSESLAVSFMNKDIMPLALRDPTSAEWLDFSPYLGLFITPQDPEVQRLASAFKKAKAHAEVFRHIKNGSVDVNEMWQLMADLFKLTKIGQKLRIRSEAIDQRSGDSITFTSLVLPGQVLTQKETVKTGARRMHLPIVINTLSAALLFASIMEALKLRPSIALVPGQAFVAWQEGDSWHYFSPGYGAQDFSLACSYAEGLMKKYEMSRSRPGDYALFKRISVEEMRAQGIHPLTTGEEESVQST
jgi:hypothetical protein